MRGAGPALPNGMVPQAPRLRGAGRSGPLPNGMVPWPAFRRDVNLLIFHYNYNEKLPTRG